MAPRRRRGQGRQVAQPSPMLRRLPATMSGGRLFFILCPLAKPRPCACLWGRPLLPWARLRGGRHGLLGQRPGRSPDRREEQLPHLKEGLKEAFPRSLERLVLHGLSPVAAELLTAKFEAAASGEGADSGHSSEGPDIDQQSFYERFYSVFEDERRAMAAFLAGKERFAFQALNRVMEGVLGLTCTAPCHERR